jgi:hypothetical protein
MPKYSPQHPILRHPQPTFVPQCQQPSFTPIQNKAKITVLCILIFVFLNSKLGHKRFSTEWYQVSPDFSLLLLSAWKEFWFVRFVSKRLNCSTLSKELLSVFMLCPPTCCHYQESEGSVSSKSFYPPTSVHGVISQNVTLWPWMGQCFFPQGWCPLTGKLVIRVDLQCNCGQWVSTGCNESKTEVNR